MVAPTRKIHRSSASAIPAGTFSFRENLGIRRGSRSRGGTPERCPSSLFERSDEEEEEEEEEARGGRGPARKTVKLL